MRCNVVAFLIFAGLAFFFWRGSLTNFFTQDDFILITEFSQNHLDRNIINVFAKPKVTHWRPIHNLYFLISGSIFGKNYVGYHLFTLLIYTSTGLLILNTVEKIFKSKKVAVISSVIYLTNPSHFISLYWISGGATLIAFFFFILSFYALLSNKRVLAVILFVVSVLASEAMLVGMFVFLMWFAVNNKIKSEKKLIISLVFLSIVFTLVRLWIFTPQTTFNVYQIEISSRFFGSLKYYLLRIMGVGDVGGALFLKSSLVFLLFLVLGKITRIEKFIIFCIFIILIGLLPFVLLPDHLSPHYMNIPIWGFAMLLGYATTRLKTYWAILLTSFICIIYFNTIDLSVNNSWVTTRSKISKEYLSQIESMNLKPGSRLVFKDNSLSTSYDAYIALGTGRAIDFWFKGRNYVTCFTFIKSCE